MTKLPSPKRFCIVASGDTFTHRHVLYQLGFLWMAAHKTWIWMYADGDPQRDEIVRSLEKLRGLTVTDERSTKFFQPV